jgi:hypothetical protein
LTIRRFPLAFPFLQIRFGCFHVLLVVLSALARPFALVSSSLSFVSAAGQTDPSTVEMKNFKLQTDSLSTPRKTGRRSLSLDYSDINCPLPPAVEERIILERIPKADDLFHKLRPQPLLPCFRPGRSLGHVLLRFARVIKTQSLTERFRFPLPLSDCPAKRKK